MSPRLRTQSVAIIAMVSVACNGPTEGGAPQDPPIVPTVPTTSEPVGRMELTFDSRESFAGLMLRMHISAYDIRGTKMNSHQAVVTSWNPSVATVEGVQPIMLQQPNGLPVNEAFAFISLRVAGSALLTVKLGDVIDSTVLNVRPLPLATNVMAVDSFTVVEYVPCATCTYLAYAPLLKLREPTGTFGADIIAVEFNVPTMTTGLCTTRDLHFAPGMSAHINYIDPYLWANDMIFTTLNGKPLPDGHASARVVVRDARGNYGLIEATGAIQRMVAFPSFPATSFVGVSWGCNNRSP